MNHFDYRDGVLHAEAVEPYRAGGGRRHAVLLLFDRDAGAALPRLRRAPSPREGADRYRGQGQRQSRVLKTLARLGAGADVVSGGELKRALAAGIPAEKIVFSGVGKTKAEMRAGARRGHLSIQCRKRAGARSADRGSRVEAGKTRACHRARQSRCRCQDPCQDLHRQVPRPNSAFPGAVRARSMPGREAAPASRSSASTCISAARSPSSSRFEAAFRVSGRTGAARCAPTAMPSRRVDLGGGLGVPYRADNEPPPDPVRSMARWSSA